MKKISFALLLFSILAFSFNLNFESGYFYIDSDILNIGEYDFGMLKLSTDTKFNGTFYAKSSLVFDQIYENSYLYFKGDFYAISLPIPTFVTALEEAYAEIYTNLGDIKVGRFVDKLPDSEVYKVYDKVGKYVDNKKLPLTGLKYLYTTDFGSFMFNVFSNLETFASNPSTYTYTVKTEIPDLYKSQILALLSSQSTPILEDLLGEKSGYGLGFMGNIFGIDYSFYLTYKLADYFVVDRVLEEGPLVKRPFIYTISNSLVYQIPDTLFMLHNYFGFESESISNFDIIVSGLGKVDIEEKVPSVLENVLGIEYQIGSDGLIGLDVYTKFLDLKYHSSSFGVYGNYTKDNMDIKGVIKYNVEDKKIGILYEAGYGFDDYTKLFIRGKWNDDVNLIMVGVKSEI
ncbi:hypothetical protein SU69_05220 [Thermosipho melanesiensis]|uniref:Uncharacterized protein n=2 Tax=Thermosipho melanesiensis TaxID=46541 RepID=A6LLT0_THEM4|nr:hypothetical protein [Thermosipho melanesiensis]ABR30881.1 hypothetical protein Tmel_1020 [Thermosipho melanesiensis BI429]APT74000.1 hypothetical protein BW47_05460 [Thermosipho melanesiensis]OOC35929.1 hypothetical protein SU68_05275 [Thermosipho melanesiensis]OOC38431.1 hypothetical protein SU69_05220 [Thermosipho melanesiensis]OOC38892.1 hypothetical protein SU70_05220 [Thermosipho melanesiensis]